MPISALARHNNMPWIPGQICLGGAEFGLVPLTGIVQNGETGLNHIPSPKNGLQLRFSSSEVISSNWPDPDVSAAGRVTAGRLQMLRRLCAEARHQHFPFLTRPERLCDW